MPVQSMPALEKTATEIVQKLAFPRSGGDDPKEALRSYLASEAALYWLFILDNANHMNILVGLPGKWTGLLDVLPQSPTGRILITTRPSQRLAEMTSELANLFLERSPAHKSQPKQAHSIAKLLEKLTYLPLTVI
ncbi:hypothetical protein N7476_011026 [Penicillium atrosanguineum]|uniref:NB-ARC domain-containing protein n=1 Tax=Penicillium atrosanguineum TaxID=1132637 RepID=A0A9W9PNQ7_9EURO|nr:hypothetical protein N7526_010306 [Penicillium atrosanguineum]KAJ5299469.1 hypothetical protein N7476_011026 [Penicillium atrosanguineum]